MRRTRRSHGGSRRPVDRSRSAADATQGIRRPPRDRWVSLVAAPALALALCAGASAEPSPAGPGAIHLVADAPRSPRTAACGLNQLLVPRCGVLWGAFAQPRAGETSQQAFLRLQSLTGSRFRILHFYHQGTDLFPRPWEIQLSRHRRLLLNWKPEAGHTWSQVAAGAADGYIDREAAYLRAHYRRRFFLVIHHEPENEVIESPGSGYTAADYAAMFRHVEERLRGDGVHNAVYVMNYMGAQVYAEQPWYPRLWPGHDFVDWIAFDPYAAPGLGPQTGGFAQLVNRHWGDGAWRGAYRWAHQHHPGKPVMLAEWGVAEKQGDPLWKAQFFDSVAPDVRTFPQLKLLSYFSSPSTAIGGDVTPDTSPTSTSHWRRLAARRLFHR